VVHGLCLLLCLIGLILIGAAVDGNDNITNANQRTYIFVFFIGTLMSFILLVNAGRSLPLMVPFSIALAFYWFPKGITIADNWRYELEEDADMRSLKKEDLQQMVSGAVLCLFGTTINVLVEIIAPKESEFKANQVFSVVAVLGFLLAFCGDMMVWIHNDRDFWQYNNYMSISISSLVAMVFAVDSIIKPHMMVLVTSIFMCTLTLCEAVVEGINYSDSDGDLETTQQGLIVVGVGMVFVLAGLIMTGANKTK